MTSGAGVFVAKAKIMGKEEYIEQTKAYGLKDVLLCFALYFAVVLVYALFGVIMMSVSTAGGGGGGKANELFVFLSAGVVSLICIGLTLLCCFIRRQGLKTIGFSKTAVIKSLVLGIVLLPIVLVLNGYPVLSGAVVKTDLAVILMRVVYYFVFVALTEELMFRGYIGTRLYGFFKNKWLAIAIVGVMFSLTHIPFQMIVSQTSLLEYVSANWYSLILFVAMHYLFQWMYTKYNSIVAPTIFHFAWDFMRWIIVP